MSDEQSMMPISATRREVADQARVVAQVLNAQIDNLRALARQLAERDTRHIVLLGSGDSWFAGMACRLAFETYAGVSAEAIQAYEYAAYGHPAFDAQTATILISSSGRPTTTWDALDRALATSAYVIGITDKPYAGNPFSEKVHAALIPGASKVGWPAQTTTATMALLIDLAIELGRARGHLSTDDADALSKQLRGTVDSMQSVLDAGDGWTQALARRLFTNDSRRVYTFVGSGPGLGVAYNGMALLAEGPQEVALVMSVEEFHHGLHIATISRDDVVIVIAPAGAASKRLLDTARSVQSWGCQLVILTDTTDTSLHAFSNDIFRLPAVPEPMTPLLSILPLQQLSIHLAENKTATGYQRPIKVP